MNDSSLIQAVEELQSTVNKLSKEINRLKMNERSSVPANQPIPPGIGCKFAYDTNGLILESLPLEQSDIPTLQISQINGLRAELDDIITEGDLKKFKSEIKSSILRRSNTPVETATKVNFDANGFVVSGSNLVADDIPNLPMSKIEGLPDIISIIESMSSPSPVALSDTYDVKAGTFTKVNVDTKGRVISGELLTMNDLPIDLITKINSIESIIPSLASQSTMDGIVKTLSKKVDLHSIPVEPGTYTKVNVNSNGLITYGTTLEVSDLPKLTIDDILDLKEELNKTAKYTDIIDLNNSVSKILSSIGDINHISTIENELKTKANSDTVDRMSREIESIKVLLVALEEKIPNEMILEQLDLINSSISSIEGRLSVLENKISNNVS